MSRKKTVRLSITSMGFPLLQKSGELGDRSECLENSGTLTETVTKKDVHSLLFEMYRVRVLYFGGSQVFQKVSTSALSVPRMLY